MDFLARLALGSTRPRGPGQPPKAAFQETQNDVRIRVAFRQWTIGIAIWRILAGYCEHSPSLETRVAAGPHGGVTVAAPRHATICRLAGGRAAPGLPRLHSVWHGKLGANLGPWAKQNLANDTESAVSHCQSQ